MRLQPVPADEIDEPLLWWQSTGPRFRPTPNSRLDFLRRSVFDHAMTAVRPGRPIKVTTYVLAGRGVDVDATHALLAESARNRGWVVHQERFTEEPADGPLPARPQFNLACRHAGSGFVDGVLATDRGAMPSTDEAYEAYLHWLRRHYAFITFLQPSYGGTPWTDR
jgi:hypothetical protein